MNKPSFGNQLRTDSFSSGACFRTFVALVVAMLASSVGNAMQSDHASESTQQFSFDGNVDPNAGSLKVVGDGNPTYVEGLLGQALSIQGEGQAMVLRLPVEKVKTDRLNDFSVLFWVRTTMPSDTRAVVLSTKELSDNSLESQKQQGWTFSISQGTWAWNAGSGNRRISYDRSNGEFLRVNDGRWHQLGMTHDSSKGLIPFVF